MKTSQRAPDLKRYAALFFDMNGTFMFGHDRLDQQQDFYTTYQQLGGASLTQPELQQWVISCCDFLRQRYDDVNYYTDFPRLAEALSSLGARTDIELIAAVIARHERGEVPDWAAQCLHTLAQTQRLAVVSNVWADSEIWRAEFQRSGLASAFSYQCYSSDWRVIKPAAELFQQALAAMALEPDQVLLIGDSLERDILPAKALGFSTVLVGSESDHAAVDYHLPSIRELLS